MPHSHNHSVDNHSVDNHGADNHGAHQHQDGSADDYADLLDLEAEVLHEYWSAALDWVRDAAAGTARGRLLDLGAGTGAGALGLARRFPAAKVTAVDIADSSLRRLRARALDLGLADRVATIEADLDAGWPDLGMLDLTWASMSLHHMADPGRVLRDALGATRPGGLIAVAEFSAQQSLRFLPDELGFGQPGFEDRAAAAFEAAHTEEMPTLGSAWAPRLAAAGWTVAAERDFPIDLSPARDSAAARYAHAWFARLSDGFGDRLEPGDRATLAELIDPHGPRSVLHRADLRIRGSRTITLGRRG